MSGGTHTYTSNNEAPGLTVALLEADVRGGDFERIPLV